MIFTSWITSCSLNSSLKFRSIFLYLIETQLDFIFFKAWTSLASLGISVFFVVWHRGSEVDTGIALLPNTQKEMSRRKRERKRKMGIVHVYRHVYISALGSQLDIEFHTKCREILETQDLESADFSRRCLPERNFSLLPFIHIMGVT